MLEKMPALYIWAYSHAQHVKLQEMMGVLGIQIAAKHHFTGKDMHELHYIT